MPKKPTSKSGDLFRGSYRADNPMETLGTGAGAKLPKSTTSQQPAGPKKLTPAKRNRLKNFPQGIG
jgi:hypothetical protein